MELSKEEKIRVCNVIGVSLERVILALKDISSEFEKDIVADYLNSKDFEKLWNIIGVSLDEYIDKYRDFLYGKLDKIVKKLENLYLSL